MSEFLKELVCQIVFHHPVIETTKGKKIVVKECQVCGKAWTEKKS